MKIIVIGLFLICCLSCTKSTCDSNVSEQVSYPANYLIDYKILEQKLAAKNSADPFDGLGHKYPSQLFRDAGLTNFDNVQMTYIPADGTLLIIAPRAFHLEVERLLKIEGKKPETK